MLLNLEKIRTDSFKIKLSDNVLDSFVQNVGEYFSAFERDIDKINPNDAVDIISALAAFMDYFDCKSEWERLTLHVLDVLRKGVNRSFFHKFANFSGMSHVAFAVKDLAIKSPKLEPFLHGINKILLDNLSAYMKKSDSKEFKTSGNFEVIKGLSGPLGYLLSGDDEQMMDISGQIVDVFIQRSKDIILLGQNIPGWHYYPSKTEKSFMIEEAINGCINYGLSHGMAGSLVTLAMAHKKRIRKEGLYEAIDGLFSEFMKSHYYDDDGIVHWPGRITTEQYVELEAIPQIPRQMSWCYGSVGILRTLYMSSVFMSNEKIEQFALAELLKIAQMDLDKYLLSQPIVCHGYVGTAAILDLMYQDTRKTEFLNKVLEMIYISISYSIDRFFEAEKQMASERSIASRASLHNHLEGYNGIIQTILSMIKGKPTGNDRRLLIV